MFPTRNLKEVAADLKLIYRAATLEEAENHLLEFVEKWENRYPVVARSWQPRLGACRADVPIYAGNPPSRRVRRMRLNLLIPAYGKSSKTALCFRMTKRCRKSYFWHCAHIAKKWTMPIPDWNGAMNCV